MSRNKRMALPTNLPNEAIDHILWVQNNYLEEFKPSNKILDMFIGIGNINFDFEHDDYSLQYVVFVIILALFIDNAANNPLLTAPDKNDLLNYRDEYIDSNMCLLAHLRGVAAAKNQKTAFSALSVMTEALFNATSIGFHSDSTAYIFKKEMTALARASEKALERRAQDAAQRACVKEELRNMMLKKAIANSDKSASRIQPDLQEAVRLKVETAKGDYPSIGLIRNLIRELVAER